MQDMEPNDDSEDDEEGGDTDDASENGSFASVDDLEGACYRRITQAVLIIIFR